MPQASVESVPVQGKGVGENERRKEDIEKKVAVDVLPRLDRLVELRPAKGKGGGGISYATMAAGGGNGSLCEDGRGSAYEV